MRLIIGPGPHYVRGSRFSYYIPFNGDPDLLKFCPSTFSSIFPVAEISGHQLIIKIDVEDPTKNNPDRQMQEQLELIKEYLSYVAHDVAPFNNGLENRVRSALVARKDKLEQINNVLAGSKYKVKEKAGTPTTYPTNSIEQTDLIEITSTGNQKPEPTLPLKQYDHILGIIKSMSHEIERTPETYRDMGEENLRDIILAQLNGHYRGRAVGEAFNKSGKTDILIRDHDKNIFIGECKIWGGDKLFSETINQLLGYTSWRDTKTALIIFNRNKNLSSVLAKIPQLVESHPNFKRKLSQVDETDFRYVLHHNDDMTRELYMAVIVVELPI